MVEDLLQHVLVWVGSMSFVVCWYSCEKSHFKLCQNITGGGLQPLEPLPLPMPLYYKHSLFTTFIHYYQVDEAFIHIKLILFLCSTYNLGYDQIKYWLSPDSLSSSYCSNYSYVFVVFYICNRVKKMLQLRYKFEFIAIYRLTHLFI